MPFCTQCGGHVGDADPFCAACGSPQQHGAASPPPPPGPSASSGGRKHGGDFVSNVHPRKAAMLCYIPIVGWIMSIVVLASDRFREDRTIRFHAFQGLYIFVIWLFVDWVFGPMTAYAEATRVLGKLLKATVFGAWIFMIVKTNQGEDFHLPVLGELADRSVSEQR